MVKELSYNNRVMPDNIKNEDAIAAAKLILKFLEEDGFVTAACEGVLMDLRDSLI